MDKKSSTSLVICLVVILLCDITVCFSVIDNETLLINDLLSNYNPRARPATGPNEAVQVDLSMVIIKLQEVNTKFQFISVLGWLNVLWYDERLKWNSSDYGGIDFITIPSPDLWIPTFVLANSGSEHLYNEFWYTLFKVRVHSDGRLKWAPGGLFKADCPIDVHFFPFDEQICQFRFENWVYTGDFVNLSYTPDAKNTTLSFNSVENGQWEILGVAVARRDKYFLDDKPFPRVHFGVHLRRKSLFYVTNIILLSVMLAFLVLFIFKLPAESGERISMGVTLLLAFSVFVLMINDSIPETSSAVPIIIVYLICFMGLTTLGICESVLVLYCYHHNGEYSAPKCMQKFFLNIMGVSLCQHRPKQKKEAYISHNGKENSFELLSGNERKKSNYERSEKDKEVCKLEWQQISRQIDIFCFWLFLTLFLFILLVLLVLLPISCSYKTMETVVENWMHE